MQTISLYTKYGIYLDTAIAIKFSFGEAQGAKMEVCGIAPHLLWRLATRMLPLTMELPKLYVYHQVST